MHTLSNFEDFIKTKTNSILIENDSGIKMCQLISKLSLCLYENKRDIPQDFISMIKSTIENDPRMSILTYNTESLMERPKEFIFLK